VTCPAPFAPTVVGRASRFIHVPDDFDAQAMVSRFRERARAVRERGVPPIEGPARAEFIEQAKLDYMDYAMIGDAEVTLADGILTMRVDLRPPEQRGAAG
jgi:hypothetical protein